jgi:hypothetical protein
MKKTNELFRGIISCDLSNRVEKVIYKHDWWWRWKEEKVPNIVYMPLDFREEHEHFLPLFVACMLIGYYLICNLSKLIWIHGVCISGVG